MIRNYKKYHFIYKTINLINKKFYIGMHSTNNLQDGYIGSGKLLRPSIKKHGEKNFKFEILEFYNTRDALIQREKEIVNENILKDPLCMNLVIGGSGGFRGNIEGCRKGAKRMNEICWSNPEFVKRKRELGSKILKKLWSEGKLKPVDWTGKHHSEKSKKLISEKAKLRIGNKSSQFGTCWITNNKENRKIKKEDLIPENWKYGRITK